MSPTVAPAERKPPAALPAVKAVSSLPPPIVPVPPPAPPPASPPAAAGPNPSPLQGRLYAPIDIACPHQNDDFTNCGAAENEPCSWQQSGMAGTFHAERIADAAAASRSSGTEPTQKDFDNAVLSSGLV